MDTRKRTKIRENRNSGFQQPYDKNTCNFVLILSDVFYLLYFHLEFINVLVVEISGFALRNSRISAYLYGYAFSSNQIPKNCLIAPELLGIKILDFNTEWLLRSVVVIFADFGVISAGHLDCGGAQKLIDWGLSTTKIIYLSSQTSILGHAMQKYYIWWTNSMVFDERNATYLDWGGNP